MQNNPGSSTFLDSTPPATTISDGPGTRAPTNEGKNPEKMSFHGGNSANPEKANLQEKLTILKCWPFWAVTFSINARNQISLLRLSFPF